MVAPMKIIFGLITFVTVGMIIGALCQLSFIWKLEDTNGIPHWYNFKEAETLRLGHLKECYDGYVSLRDDIDRQFYNLQECDYLRALAKPRLQVSTVVDARTGKGVKSSVRTSSGMFLSSSDRKYGLVQAIEKRIAVFSQVPSENGELIQVLRWVSDLFTFEELLT
ncbi:unnamed protein product [Linum tenue]|uniref:Uncharacterized protein n=1 Tax=Linum tenue TaxID=586396 RepID=A0AAV0M1I1_9ROSI|nr:unnamed protein product [Linum tenue]